MSYTISVSGHTERREEVKAAFHTFCNELRAIGGISTATLSDNDGTTRLDDVPSDVAADLAAAERANQPVPMDPTEAPPGDARGGFGTVDEAPGGAVAPPA